MARHAKRSRKRGPRYEEGEALREERKVDVAELGEREAPLPPRRPPAAIALNTGAGAAPRRLPPDPVEAFTSKEERDAETLRAWLVVLASSVLWLLLARRRA